MIYSTLKKLTEPFIAAIFLLLLSPLFCAVALVSAAATRQWPIFSQSRALAHNGRMFTMYKFRTLRAHTPRSSHPADERDVFLKPHFADAVPPLCQLLRRSGFDELPQLLNVVKGEMSIVGPRPLDLKDLKIIASTKPDLNERRKQLTVLPGITGTWQMYGDRSLGAENLIELDEEYSKHVSFKRDLAICLLTMKKILSGLHSGAI